MSEELSNERLQYVNGARASASEAKNIWNLPVDKPQKGKKYIWGKMLKKNAKFRSEGKLIDEESNLYEVTIYDDKGQKEQKKEDEEGQSGYTLEEQQQILDFINQ